MNTNFVAMAFSKGTVSTEGTEIKRYIGVCPFNILAVNPNKAELSKIYDREIEEEPVYVSKVTNADGKEVDNVRLDFIVKSTNPDVDLITKATFFIKNEYRYNKDKTKVQVIDEFGRTCWVTIEQAKAKEIPVYSNGPANITKNYRPCFVGEEDVTNLLKNYLCIPNVMKYVNGSWVMNDNTKDSECRLDSVANYFKGDVKELKEIVSYQPENKVKLMLGVRTTDENKQYQAVYTQMTLRNSVKDYSKLDKDLQERKANGAYSTTEFKAEDIHEYSNTPTTFTAPAEDPFATPSDNAWFN